MRYEKRSLRQKIGLGHEHKTLSFIRVQQNMYSYIWFNGQTPQRDVCIFAGIQALLPNHIAGIMYTSQIKAVVPMQTFVLPTLLASCLLSSATRETHGRWQGLKPKYIVTLLFQKGFTIVYRFSILILDLEIISFSILKLGYFLTLFSLVFKFRVKGLPPWIY